MGKLIYQSVQRTVENLLWDVENGRIGLPDLQRQFVWKDSKVRDLLDSMIKGYPIGIYYSVGIPRRIRKHQNNRREQERI